MMRPRASETMRPGASETVRARASEIMRPGALEMVRVRASEMKRPGALSSLGPGPAPEESCWTEGEGMNSAARQVEGELGLVDRYREDTLRANYLQVEGSR